MEAYAFTFGTAHDEEHRAIVPFGTLSKGFVVIHAPSFEVARSIALALFGSKWAFQYELREFLFGDKNSPQWYPQGCLLELQWLTERDPSWSWFSS